jgi:methanogen homoaconitase large subunit
LRRLIKKAQLEPVAMSTLSERILGAPAGEYVDRKVDRAYAHDGTGVLALEAWKRMSGVRLSDTSRMYLQFDHIVPANNGTTATLQHELRDFARSSFMHFSDIGGASATS